MGEVQGGNAMNIKSTGDPPLGGPAWRVVIVSDRPSYAGPALPVRVVSDAEVAAGAFTVLGNVPIPVVVAAGDDPVMAGNPTPVYIVS